MFGKQAFFYLVSLTILLPMQSPAFLPVVAAGLQIADTMMDMSKSARVAIDVSDYLDLIDAGALQISHLPRRKCLWRHCCKHERKCKQPETAIRGLNAW